MRAPIAEISRLSKTFTDRGKTVHAVRDVSFSVKSGETVAIIGESGSGKSTLGRLILGLEVPDSGQVIVEGQNLARLDSSELRKLRSNISVVFQEPFESLNPRQSVGSSVGEPLRIHPEICARDKVDARVAEALQQVALDPSIAARYPGDLSGGQQQRIGIARAIVTRPSLVILDEPTSSLDLSVRAQIVELLQQLQDDVGMAYVFISHDIHTVEYVSDRMIVMYSGAIMEEGLTDSIIQNPQHPYTRALLSSRQPIDPRKTVPEEVLLPESVFEVDPTGCLFYQRCPLKLDKRCEFERPSLTRVDHGHSVASFCVGANAITPEP